MAQFPFGKPTFWKFEKRNWEKKKDRDNKTPSAKRRTSQARPPCSLHAFLTTYRLTSVKSTYRSKVVKYLGAVGKEGG